MFKYYTHISIKHGYRETIVINCTVNIERNAIGMKGIERNAIIILRFAFVDGGMLSSLFF